MIEKEIVRTIGDETESIQTKKDPEPPSPPPSVVALPLHPHPRATSKPIYKALKSTLSLTPVKFPLNRLPPELRIKIWTASLVPRVHELHPCAKLYHNRMTFRSNSSETPAIFHACRESREVALRHHKVMAHEPTGPASSGKGILRFYFCPALDTLLLNSLMGLFMMFVLLEEGVGADYAGTMKWWQTVAFDAERAQLITLLSGIPGHNIQPRMREIFPQMKQLVIAFDYKKNGKTRFRTSVWPGENGTSLKAFPWPVAENEKFEEIFNPMREFLRNDYLESGEVPEMVVAKVKRKAFIRGDIRYVFRKGCAYMHVKPRGIFKRI